MNKTLYMFFEEGIMADKSVFAHVKAWCSADCNIVKIFEIWVKVITAIPLI